MAEHGKATYVTFWNASVVYSSLTVIMIWKIIQNFLNFTMTFWVGGLFFEIPLIQNVTGAK